MLRPLSDWLLDAKALDRGAFCAKHPHPLLVHTTTGYKLRPIVNTAMTIDRAVLAAALRPPRPSGGIDDYLAVEVRAAHGTRSFDLIVGCGNDVDIWIDDVTVSARHAHMSRDREGSWYVRDASSTTGTHVNDRDYGETQALVAGDRISFGMVDLCFYPPEDAYDLIRKLG